MHELEQYEDTWNKGIITSSGNVEWVKFIPFKTEIFNSTMRSIAFIASTP